MFVYLIYKHITPCSKSLLFHLKKNVMIVLLACLIGFCLGRFFVQVLLFVALLLVSIAKMLFETILAVSKIAFRMIKFIYGNTYLYYQKNKIGEAETRTLSPQ